MKLLNVFSAMLILFVSSLIFAAVDVKKEPLTWKQARLTEGEGLYATLCAACHGKKGKGDGPVSGVLKKSVPDLTLLAKINNGVFPHQQVSDSIEGGSRVESHGTVDMPVWGDAFEGVRPDWKMYRREAVARQRIHNLVEYLSTIQSM